MSHHVRMERELPASGLPGSALPGMKHLAGGLEMGASGLGFKVWSLGLRV